MGLGDNVWVGMSSFSCQSKPHIIMNKTSEYPFIDLRFAKAVITSCRTKA